MKSYKYALLHVLCLLMLTTSSIFAQQKILVKGNVSSESDGEPLAGATVHVQNQSTKWVVTDKDGNYSIKVSKGATLIFEFIGFEKQILKVNKSEINVRLKTNAVQLNEAVSIGYGTVRKKELTGAATQVSSKDLSHVVNNDLGMALQGMISGVTVSASSGDPGSVGNIQIRGVTSMSGDNTPLFVVDGIPQEGNPNISTNEIATIDILKDAASCAIYGTRGATGVILITTKQGQEGKMKFAFDASYGFQSIAYNRLPDLMNTNEQTYAEILYYRQSGTDVGDMDASYGLSKYTNYYKNDTDFTKMLLASGNSPIQQYNINMSGGSKSMKYNITLGYYDQDGLILNSGYNRYNLRNNLVYNHGKLSMNFNTSASIEAKQKASGSSLTQAIKMKPYYPAVERGLSEYVVPDDNEAYKIASLLRLYETTNETNTSKASFNYGINYKLFKDLTLSSKLGYNYSESYNEYFVPSVTVYDTEGNEISPGSDNDKIQNATRRNTSLAWNGVVTYSHNFNKKHKLTATIASSYQEYNFKGFYAGRKNLISNSIKVINAGTDDQYAYSYDYYTDRLFGFIGRLQYNYKSKYLFSASMRSDASTKFSSDNKWGYFPSASIGWNVSDEKFWRPLKKVANICKLRASYGTTGNNRFSSYTYQETISTGYDYVDTSNGMIIGTTQTTYANEDVKWETSKQINVGLDLGFLKNSIVFTADAYYTSKDDMLATVQIPSSTGVGTSNDSKITMNIGDMINKGYELNLTYKHSFNKLWMRASLNFSQSTNEVTNLGGTDDIIYNAASTIISGDANSVTTAFSKGYEAGSFFLLKSAGVANTEEKLEEFKKIKSDAILGDEMYEDVNGDGYITTDDRVYCGSGLPDFEMGFNMNLTYKNFDFSMMWYACLGNEVINGPEALSYSEGRNLKLLSQWSNANQNSEIPTWRGNSKAHMNYIGYSDLWVEDGSYARMKNITLGYTLSKSIAKWMNVSQVRVFFSGQNLITLTGYTGMDPDVGGNGLTTRGLDKGYYPTSKQYLFGLKINF